MNALGVFFSKHRLPREEFQSLLVGSVKSNIGHTESAAGAAGLIKVLLMMKHGNIVPSLHVRKDKSNINKQIKLRDYNLDIAVDVTEWKVDKSGRRIACVNSFGFGGSNSHAVVLSDTISTSNVSNKTTCYQSNTHCLICLSAIDKESLQKNIDAFAHDVKSTDLELKDVSYTSMFYREHQNTRTLLYGTNAEELSNQAQQRKRQISSIKPAKKRNIVFIFCGVGTAWQGMCRQMMTFDTFNKKVTEIDKFFEPLAGWTLEEKFKSDSSYDDPFINHVGIFATQVALAAVWQDWNITPDRIVGQSVGEVAAAHIAGVLTLEEAVKVIYHRSKLLATQSGGSMMVVSGKAVEEMKKLCSQYKSVEIAVYSSPIACTLSGKTQEIANIKDELQGEQLMIRELKVDCAYHSPLVDECLQDIIDVIGVLKSRAEYKTPIISTVNAAEGSNKDYITGTYWAENVRRPVLLYQAIQKTVVGDAHNIFIEIGPRQVLRAHIDNILSGIEYVCLPSMNAKKEFASVFSSLAELYQLGEEINWTSFYRETRRPICVPRSVFNRKKQIHFGPKGKNLLEGTAQTVDKSHMFVYREGRSEEGHFKLCVDKDHTPFVYDHFLSDTLLVPGATYVEAAFHIGLACLNKQSSDIVVSMEFESFVTPADDAKTEIEVKCKMGKEEICPVFKHGGRQVASGKVSSRMEQNHRTINIENLKENLHIHRDKQSSYQCLTQLQFTYGPKLSLIERSWAANTQCLVELLVPNDILPELPQTIIHPAVVDAIFQTFGILSSNGTSAVPRGVKEFAINGQCKKHMFVYACEVKSTQTRKYYNALLMTEYGHVIADVRNFFTKSLSSTVESLESLKYVMSFERLDLLNMTFNGSSGVVMYALNASALMETIASELKDFHIVATLDTVALLKPETIVVFSGDQTKENPDIKTSVQLFQDIRRLLLKLSREEISCPLYIVTYNCYCPPGRRYSTTMSGSEVWGMIRSVRYENILPDIRLVDVDERLDSTTFAKVIKNASLKQQELFIVGHDVYYAKLEKQESVANGYVEASMGPSQRATLFSDSNNIVEMPHFKPDVLNERHGFSDSDIEVVVESFVLHDKSLYPNTEGSGKTIDGLWSKEKGNCFSVTAIEGRGRTTKEHTEEVIFCYPTPIECPYTKIPRECVVPLKFLHVYADGMLIAFCLLYKLAEMVPTESRVIVIKEKDEDNFLVHCLTTLIRSKRCSVIMVDKDESPKCVEGSVSVLLLCTKLREENLMKWLERNTSIKNVVTSHLFLTKTAVCQVNFKKRNITSTVVDISTAFTYQFLRKAVPCFSVLMTQAVDIQQDFQESKQKILVWKMPMKTLMIRQNNASISNIPLRLGQHDLFRKKGCYIIVGGLTGLGKLLLSVIAEAGAGVVANFSRRMPSQEQHAHLQDLERKTGCKIHSIRADISSLDSLRQGLKNLECLLKEIPVRGIFHGAGFLSDALLINQTEESLKTVLSPKVQGSWNLHICSKKLPLDYFVMHSSIVSILGNGGQSNYAAGNSFIDSLAVFRRSQGLCGQSINWGALSVGMAAADRNVVENLKNLGHSMLTQDEIQKCFIDALLSQSVQVCYAKLHWETVLSSNPNAFPTEKYNGLKSNHVNASEAGSTGETEGLLISSMTEGEKEDKIRQLIRGTVCNVFVVSNDNLDDFASFVSLGADSMSAMSFVNSVNGVLKIRIPIMKILSEHANVDTVTKYCLENVPRPDNGVSVNLSQPTETISILDDEVSFMQESVVKEYLKNKNDISLIHLIDVELAGLKLTLDDWRKIFRYILEAHTELSVNFFIDTNGKVTQRRTAAKQNVVEETSFVNLEQEQDDNYDPRESFSFDLEKEIPLKVKAAIGKDRSVIRLAIHKTVSDLASIALLGLDLAKGISCLKGNRGFPKIEQQPDVCKLMKNTLSPNWQRAERFWKEYLKDKTKPTSMSRHYTKPDAKSFQTETRTMNKETLSLILKYMQERGLTLFQMMASVYQLVLHMETSEEHVTITTAVDMRAHVSELSNIIARCVNVVPLISTARRNEPLQTFVDANGKILTEILENSFYPRQLIMSQVENTQLKENVDRHYLVMNNMQMVNESLIVDGNYSAEIKQVWAKRKEKETVLYVNFDLKRNEVDFELCFESSICGNDGGSRMMDKMFWLIEIIIQNKTLSLGEILQNKMHLNGKPPKLISNGVAEKARVVTPANGTNMSHTDYGPTENHTLFGNQSPPSLKKSQPDRDFHDTIQLADYSSRSPVLQKENPVIRNGSLFTG